MSDPVAIIKYRKQYKNTRSRSGFAFYTVRYLTNLSSLTIFYLTVVVEENVLRENFNFLRELRWRFLPGLELGELAGHMAGIMTTCEGRGEVSARGGAEGAGWSHGRDHDNV